jgi:hypothetical protein
MVETLLSCLQIVSRRERWEMYWRVVRGVATIAGVSPKGASTLFLIGAPIQKESSATFCVGSIRTTFSRFVPVQAPVRRLMDQISVHAVFQTGIRKPYAI